MNILYIDSSTDKELMLDFCKDSVNESRKSNVNYNADYWRKNPASLMYKLYVEKIYDHLNKGCYAVIIDDDKILAGAGLCKWDQDPDTAIYMSRLYTRVDSRGEKQSRIIHIEFPLYDRAIELGYKVLMCSFNEYNLKLREVTYNTNNPENFKNYYSIDNKHYTSPVGRRILPQKKYEFPVMINHTKQWVLYHMLDQNYEQKFLKKLDSLAIR
jgi:hypothetical protein